MYYIQTLDTKYLCTLILALRPGIENVIIRLSKSAILFFTKEALFISACRFIRTDYTLYRVGGHPASAAERKVAYIISFFVSNYRFPYRFSSKLV